MIKWYLLIPARERSRHGPLVPLVLNMPVPSQAGAGGSPGHPEGKAASCPRNGRQDINVVITEGALDLGGGHLEDEIPAHEPVPFLRGHDDAVQNISRRVVHHPVH